MQCYFDPKYPEKIYAGAMSTSPSDVSPLSSRTFGTWTILSAVIRLYAAYYTDNKAVYELATWTFGIALVHFSMEWMVFKTTRLTAGFIAPLCVASGSLTWMLLQKEAYVH
jgi:hypothetical protein